MCQKRYASITFERNTKVNMFNPKADAIKLLTSIGKQSERGA